MRTLLCLPRPNLSRQRTRGATPVCTYTKGHWSFERSSGAFFVGYVGLGGVKIGDGVREVEFQLLEETMGGGGCFGNPVEEVLEPSRGGFRTQ